jgi:hypothetical protein
VPTRRGYEESELISNRTSVLLYGGLEEERRAWAEEAASFFPEEGPLREVRTLAELTRALAEKRGVVYLPDVLKLPSEAQAALVRCLAVQEERPKLVVGLVGAPDAAREKGTLSDDLHYRLHRALVDLSQADVRNGVIHRRMERPLPKPLPKTPPKPPAGGAGRRPPASRAARS